MPRLRSTLLLFGGGASGLAASIWGANGPAIESNSLGFRLAMIPEPTTGLLVVAGLLGLAGWHRVRH